MKKVAGIILIFLQICFFTSVGQSNHINLSATDETFLNVIKKIESQTNTHFYFDSKETDSLRITVEARDLDLNQLLTKILANTGFQFATRDNDVFISRNKIQTEIVSDFFDMNKVSLNTDSSDFVVSDKKKGKIKTTADYKLFEIGNKTAVISKGKVTLAGYVKDVKNGEAISGATVFIESPLTKTVTDQFGYYSIVIPKGRNTLHVNSFGMKDTKREIMLYNAGKFNIEMEDYVPTLMTVVINSEKRSNVRAVQMGVDKLNIRTIKQIPTVLGESDILRIVLTLPGVTSVGEASTGFNVRGGASDQNLVLLNDATIFNPSHLFGFFSAFNTDVVKGVELYKSAIPEKYGGRLSSVLDVATRDGNSKKFTATGGAGLLTSRLTLESPLDKGKTTFILSGRTSYSNWLLKEIPNKSYSNSSASFYDLNLNITHTINPKNTIYLTGYASHDKFRLNSDTLYQYGNRNAILKWKHNFNNKLHSVVSGGIDNYYYDVSSNAVKLNAFKLSYQISQFHFRSEFTYLLNSKHALNFGIQSIYYQNDQGSFQPADPSSLVATTTVPREQALESAIYLGDKYTVTSNFSISAGIRYGIYNYLGPHDQYQYLAGEPRQTANITDTLHYTNGKIIKTYQNPEVRIGMRYSINDNTSLKFSYNTLTQYLHTLSNTSAISPTDIFKLSDSHIPPQKGYQLSLGYYENFHSNLIETSVEIYYKQLHNYLDYKSNATLVLNKHIETDVINTSGTAYGAEFMIKKTEGKINGWISYTYSSTKLRMDDPIAGEQINRGNAYPANFDKPHNINFIGNYRFSHRMSLSLNLVYSTGRPITLPIALYYQGGAQRVLYSERNQFRIPDYFRTDVSVNLDGNHKVKTLAHSSWSFGVYNLTARQNPYSIYFIQQNGLIKGYQLSIFGTAIPFITYNFKF